MKKQNYTKSSSNSISLSQPEPHRSSISLHLLFHVYIPIFYFCLYITQLEGNYLNYKFFRSLKLLIKFYFQCKSIHAPTKQSFLTASQTWQELHFYFNLLHLIMKPFSRSKYCIKSPQLKKERGGRKRYLVKAPHLFSRDILLSYLSFAFSKFWKVPIKTCFGHGEL